jgi:lipopolysaccharide/colanic/teichoic acid biosynthesis glycosyltransferase
MLDIAIALALLIPAAVLSLVAMIFLFAEMRANPLFRQTRVGRHKRPFTILKLRTMRPDTADAASHEVQTSQITRTGRIVRRIKFDELPQIFNVLAGQMSFVGPRPCLPIQRELIEERDRLGVYQLRPGITGPAQLAGIDMSEPRRLAMADRAYLAPWSAARDLAILARTFLGRGSGDAALAAGSPDR